ncbi:uncharacterized protein LOC127833370 [Dreissena polymorpha]|uniref:THD domain-containing protein n=1 Tax=Dreissena polymorpha TaxID=45954 RepID=A0A9D4JJ76_DREPO|nr:uncharacterized protein LOC127833370 [Dreissena polymorpha]KAH3810753.1 hypothetical protein DPMN_139150 [Dreissena polymorpha]
MQGKIVASSEIPRVHGEDSVTTNWAGQREGPHYVDSPSMPLRVSRVQTYLPMYTEPEKTATGNCRLLKRLFRATINIVITVAISVFVTYCLIYNHFIADKIGHNVAEAREKINPTNKVSTFGALAGDTSMPANQHNVYAVFSLDQVALNNTGDIRWLKSDGSDSVTPNKTDSCVVVKQGGLYGAFSQITFKFSPSSKERVGHSIYVIRHGTANETMIQKRNLDKPQLRLETHTFLQPSNINAFVSLSSGDQVCVNPSPPDMVYKSAVDNILTVVRLAM